MFAQVCHPCLYRKLCEDVRHIYLAQCNGLVVSSVKPLHCSFTVWWFSGVLKSSCRYFSSKTTCPLEGREITAKKSSIHQPYRSVPNRQEKEI